MLLQAIENIWVTYSAAAQITSAIRRATLAAATAHNAFIAWRIVYTVTMRMYYTRIFCEACYMMHLRERICYVQCCEWLEQVLFVQRKCYGVSYKTANLKTGNLKNRQICRRRVRLLARNCFNLDDWVVSRTIWAVSRTILIVSRTIWVVSRTICVVARTIWVISRTVEAYIHVFGLVKGVRFLDDRGINF